MLHADIRDILMFISSRNSHDFNFYLVVRFCVLSSLFASDRVIEPRSSWSSNRSNTPTTSPGHNCSLFHEGHKPRPMTAIAMKT